MSSLCYCLKRPIQAIKNEKKGILFLYGSLNGSYLGVLMFPLLAVPEVPGLVILPPPTALGELDAFVLLSGPVVVSC